MPNKETVYDRHLGLRFGDVRDGDEGIEFDAVAADGARYAFRVETRALDLLGADDDAPALQRFEMHRDEIERLAKTLVMLGVDAEPIVLKAAHFASQPWRRRAVATA